MLKFRNTLTAICAISFATLAPLSASADETTLYDKLGGHDGVTEIISDMLDYSLSNPRISHIFDNSNIPRLQNLLVEHICSLTDGGCVYTGQDMDKSHAGLGIDNRHFNALVEDLQKAMDDNDIPFRTQNKLLAILAPMHDDITKYSDY